MNYENARYNSGSSKKKTFILYRVAEKRSERTTAAKIITHGR